jgi:acyl carrier protein
VPNRAEVEIFVKNYLGKKLAGAGISDLAPDFKLIDSGLVDSFGLLDLVSAAEKKFSVELDLSSVDIDTFTTFGGFVDTIAGGP